MLDLPRKEVVWEQKKLSSLPATMVKTKQILLREPKEKEKYEEVWPGETTFSWLGTGEMKIQP